ncbi:MAG: hypothetical protein ACQCN6_10050 [Candidatus Bathyarchaeia archaeon]|jgi:hypothetical protein
MAGKKYMGLVLATIVILASAALIYSQQSSTKENSTSKDTFYFGVSFGGDTPQEAKTLIDRVKNYTNFILINSYPLMTNETALNEVCDYAFQANLKFVVYFQFISRIAHPWHQLWLDTAEQRWGDMFLGVHFMDEPGGKQIDTREPVTNASSYGDAANQFIYNISASNSMIDAKNKSISTFTSDYALYWWDYLAGYDTVFVELGWGLSSTRQIALCRGAADMQGKDWGAIIVWTYNDPPYLASAQEIYADMLSAYTAGARYVVMFNYPTYPEGNPYGILSEEHLAAMEEFWNYTAENPRENGGIVHGDVALVLPKDYAWGMRHNQYITNDKIWGLWPEDEKAPLIRDNTEKLLNEYGLQLDIIYEDEKLDYNGKYSRVFLWNATQIDLPP